jgi:hypothetical protein
MARNSVQFQKGLSEVRFDELYGSEDRCREAVFGWRWPHGFVCPGCGGQQAQADTSDDGALETAALPLQ